MNMKLIKLTSTLLLTLIIFPCYDADALELNWGGGMNNYITDTSASGWGQETIPNQLGDVGNVNIAGSMLIMNEASWAGTLKMGQGTTLGINHNSNPNGTWTDVHMDGASLLSSNSGTWSSHKYVGNASSKFIIGNGGMGVNHSISVAYWVNMRANIEGTGDLELVSAGRLGIQSMISTAGDTFVQSGNVTFSTAAAGLTFYINSNGENNKLYGNAGNSKATFNTALLMFDLSQADSTFANEWNVVDIASFGNGVAWTGATVSSTIGAFTSAGDIGSRIWTLQESGNTWAFSETTGNLTVVPEPATVSFMLLSGVIGFIKRRRLRP